jgi:hypothetical protein
MDTATVNPKKKSKGKKKKRRNPSSYGGAKKTAARRRTRTTTPRRSTRRTSNPTWKGLMSFDRYMKILPPAGLGNVAGRLAVKQAGPFVNGEPGMKHAIAGAVGVALGSNLIGTAFRDARAAEYAYASGLGYLMELFMRKRFFKDSPWYQDNVSLEGDSRFDQRMDGCQQQNPCGKAGEVYHMPNGEVHQILAGVGQQSFRTADGKQWQQTATGWQMAGPNAARDYLLEEPTASLPGGSLRGFQANSQLGTSDAAYRGRSSFGYGR